MIGRQTDRLSGRLAGRKTHTDREGGGGVDRQTDRQTLRQTSREKATHRQKGGEGVEEVTDIQMSVHPPTHI